MKTLNYTEINMSPSIFMERANTNLNYLKELNLTSLLQNFYWEAGIIIPGTQVLNDPTSQGLHWGWESPTCQLRGHFLGHWMSAVAQTIARTGDEELKYKLNHVVDELEKCQKKNGGKWVGSIPEKYFELLKSDSYIWSPQYTMHKTIMGLLHAYEYAGIKKAKKILSNLADWYVKWTDRMLKECPAAIFNGEMGGMLEIWAECAEVTGEKKYLTLADRYSKTDLFEKLIAGEDALSNIHTNSTIPWSHGAAKMYEITGDEKWKKAVFAFWKCAVTDRGMFATTGNNAGEYWIPPKKHGTFVSDRDQEFCTVYNMVRTAHYLLSWTGDAEYADYIEQALYNGFLAQQNKFTGMPDYFLSLIPGSRKEWGSKTSDFWCCHGTTVQAHTIYSNLVYYYETADEKLKTVKVAQYIPSTGNFVSGKNKISISQATDMHYSYDQTFFSEKDSDLSSRWQTKFTVKCDSAENFEIALRLPSWVSGNAELSINGIKETVKATNGWICLSKEWKEDEITVFFPSKVRLVDLPGNEEMACLMEGPIVLAGLIDADLGLKNSANLDKALIQLNEHCYATFPWKQSSYQTQGQDKNFPVIPLYEVTDEKYTVYFTKK